MILLISGQLLAQPVIDGTFDGETLWGAPVAIADLSPGWANANAKKLYVVHSGAYVYFGAEVTASTWMNWAFTLHIGAGGGSTDSWSRSIDYTNANKVEYVLRGHFNGYAEYHTWNGSTWSGTGSAVPATEFADNITGDDQNGWVELRILKSALANATTADIQFYITGNQNDHGSFDAVPNDDNSTSWNQSAARTPLDNHQTGIIIGTGPVVTISPLLPGDNEPITVIFNAASTPLASAAKVYFHSGITTSVTQPNAFHRVVGNWGADDGVGEMTATGTDMWQIIIPSCRTFYGLDPTEDVFGLNFLFRNADGTVKEDNNGANYHTDINPGSYFTINQPAANPFFAEVNVAFTTQATANTAPTTWTLEEVDHTTNAFISSVTSQSGNTGFTYNLTLNNTSLRKFKFSALFGSTTKYKFFEAIAHAPVVLESRPIGTKPGINYHSSDYTKATLVLHAPVYTRMYGGTSGPPTAPYATKTTAPKSVVYLVGDFNNWTPSETWKLKRDRDGWDGTNDADGDDDRGDYWWIELNGLVPGQNYVFQYLTDNGIMVADPYANQVSDIEDTAIPASVYAGLPAYPSAASDRAAVLRTGQTAYAWQATPFVKPSTNNLNIYELHFRDFTEEGTYLGAVEKLDYLKSTGINAIHVMPVSEFEGNSSWGYNPNFYFAADKAYGTSNDLKYFIDECHKRKIQVFNDLVLNHAFNSNAMARLYWNASTGKPSTENPWFNENHQMIAEPAGWWGVDWNHESEHTRSMVDRILDYWLQEFKFDGFRFDFTKGFGQTPQDPSDPWASSYDQSRVDILKRMVDSMWVRNPGSVAIFEHLAVNAEDKVLADHGISLWSGVGHHNDVKSFVLGWNGDNPNLYDSGIYNAPARNFIFANWISYAESHDEERLGYELMQYFNGQKTKENMIKRLKLGSIFNSLFPGPRMLWQFQELGYDYSINFNGRTGEKPVRWDYFDDEKRRELYTLMTKLFTLRNSYSLYATTPDYGNIGLGSGNITVPRRMKLHDGMGHYVISIANLDPELPHDVTPGYDVAGTWYRYNGDPAADGTSFNVSTLTDTYPLVPSESFILTNFPIDDCKLVYKTSDSGPGSLRDAIACAGTGDTIVFSYAILNDTVHLTAPITIDKNLVILAEGNSSPVINGYSASRIFDIETGVNVELINLDFIPGSATIGRCISNQGNLTIQDVNINDLRNDVPQSVLSNSGLGNIIWKGTSRME
ncbi:MAG: hypothetical protein IPN29_08265 [Saprospiraceae bacterium]|nr:hypothetical protein [Saprospiraceae bacterium]